MQGLHVPGRNSVNMDSINDRLPYSIWTRTMHSHTSLENLIKQAEQWAENRDKKSFRPGWLTEFIYDAADLFTPVADAARVGYDCRYYDNSWQVLFYLGDGEMFGGKHDGKRTRMAFEFDLKDLLSCFKQVDSVVFRTLNDDLGLTIEEGNMLEIVGVLKESDSTEAITVGILSRPPREAGPGMKVLPNGEVEPV